MFGWARCSSTVRVWVSAQWDWVAPAIVSARLTARCSTCANGKKVTTRLPGRATSPMSFLISAQVWCAQLPWVKATPFGRPVVPDVYTMDPRSSWVREAERASTSDCSTSLPSNLTVSTPAALNS